ncbi:MAG: (d)CMP kinase [Hyphomicrobiaceae bacterium]
MIIAVDGPAASGKGTLARRLASHYGFAYLDTGALYRAVARDVRAANRNLRDEAAAEEAARNLDAETLKDPFLRDRGVGEAASIVARFPMVREALRDYQRSFARRKPGAVLDGRDIGTVVCPDADVKLYVTAGLEERARRRFHELRAKNFEVTRAEILEQIRKRDERDKGRDASPLTRAPDAYLLDTTDLDIEAAFKSAVELIDEIIDS